MLDRLTLNPEAADGRRCVKVGRILRVILEHWVSDSARRAQPGDFAVELVDQWSGKHVSYGYLTGPSRGLYRAQAAIDAAEEIYAPASVVRLSDIEAAQRELGAENTPEAIDAFAQLAIDNLQRAKHSEHDFALLDLETGADYRRIGHVFEHWWMKGEPPADLQRKRDEDRTCTLVVRSVRNLQIHRRRAGSRFHSKPQATVTVVRPPARPDPMGSSFLLDALVEAVLPS
jgi:hypothetical protein